MASPSRQTEPIAFEPGWTSLPGRILTGGFELQEILAADEWQANLKVRVLGDRELDCAAHCFRLPQSIADEQVAIWQTTRELRHPNLSAPLGAGTLEIEGECIAYAVVRRADESLNAVLAERALTVGETREALDSIAHGLEALHINGLAHGCLSPSQVLAVGEAIKLPVGCVRAFGVRPSLEIQKSAYLAPESTGENLTAEADLWCLGATVFEALTQQAWTEDLRGHLDAIPEPFATIAFRCLEDDPTGRATLGEVAALLSGQLKPTPRIQIAPASALPEVVLEPLAAAQTVNGEGLPSPPRIYVEDAGSATAKDVTTAKVPAASPVVTNTGVMPSAMADSAASSVITPDWAGQIPADKTVISGNRSEISLPLVTDSAQAAQVLSDTVPAKQLDKADDVRPILVARPRWEDVVGHNTSIRAEEEQGSTNLWIWAIVALLVVVGLIWILRPKSAANARVAAPATATSPANAIANNAKSDLSPIKGTAGKGNGPATPAGNAWETRTLQPDGSAPRVATPASSAVSTTRSPAKMAAGAAVSRAVPSAPAVNTSGAEPWRLVLYTYRSQEDATRRANSINGKHSNLHCEVFSPSGSGSPYLVVAGGRMSRDQAAQLRRKAMSLGLPHDSYIQNYKH